VPACLPLFLIRTFFTTAPCPLLLPPCFSQVLQQA
jgi:hypothetical protein